MSQKDIQAVSAIRVLAAESVQKANSGHPGLPLGAAPAAYALWQYQLKHNPADPQWKNRDRFVLSAGHGSALLYALLHLYGYGLTIEDLKQFRQWGSKTPGHPEYGHTIGVETTTGPLGQGIANAVGMAMAEAHLAALFNKEGFPVVDHRTYTIVGDGCLMEGISYEAAALAGTLKLGKLTVLYDSNRITIEGSTDIAFREDVPARFAAQGWHTQVVEEGNDVEKIAEAIENAKKDPRPSLIQIKTEIGYGCPAKQGKASAHGEPLGVDNLNALKENFGWPLEPAFFVPEEVYATTGEACAKGAEAEEAWKAMFTEYEKAYPELAAQYKEFYEGGSYDPWQDSELFAKPDKPNATRNLSGNSLNYLAKKIPNFFGGSADLSPSNKSTISGSGDFSAEDYTGQTLHFGVREHAMAAIANGIALHGGLQPYVATFFVFSDYMKHSMRLSALMKQRVIYILTHDSIGVGEDGPTHEPVEHLAALRSIPGMTVFRPADACETAVGWAQAVTADGPTALVLTRQNLPQYPESCLDARKGAYILREAAKEEPDVLLMASGSEVELIYKAAEELAKEGIEARVISMPSFELFEKQPEEYKEQILPKNVRRRVAVEALTSFGWHKYVGLDGACITLDHFGASAPAARIFEEFGFTVQNVVDTVKGLF